MELLNFVEFIADVFFAWSIVFGGITLILAFAWFVGWVFDKMFPDYYRHL